MKSKYSSCLKAVRCCMNPDQFRVNSEELANNLEECHNR